MKLRTAKRGRNADGQFWGCSRYPKCKGTRDYGHGASEAEDSGGQAEPTALAADGDLLFVDPRVVWTDHQSSQWDRIYTIGGGSLRSIDLSSHVDLGPAQRRLEQTFMAVHPPASFANRPSPSTQQVTGILRKILQRGDAPPSDPDVERALLLASGVLALEDPEFPGDMAFAVSDVQQLPDPEDLRLAANWSSEWFEPDPPAVFDSDEEEMFYGFVLDEYGPHAARWLYPQASLDRLLEGRGGKGLGFRRVDFLFAPPWAEPHIIEIDGLQHDDAEAVDADRDDALGKVGLGVLRIQASDVRTGSTRSDSELRALLTPPEHGVPSQAALRLLYGPAAITRFGLAIAEALDRGWIEGAGSWAIEVSDVTGAVEFGARSIIELLGAVDELWAGYLAPESVSLSFTESNRSLCLRRDGAASYSVSQEVEPAPTDFCVRFEIDRGPLDRLELPSDGKVIVFRASTVPVRFAETRTEGERMAVAQDPHVLGDALRRVLQFVFAKKDFWEGQEASARHLLQGGDTVVLLPTGAGKSLVYQLVGLLLPGRTLIVDPIVALIEDQVSGLRKYGIDRAVGITGAVVQQGLIDQALSLVKRGDALFFFVSPERLQQQSFRDSLRELTVGTPINLAVVDEAHCVSEWGHDFRPAYLGLGNTLRVHTESADGSSPPLLALTGTASRAVLRDVLIELDLDRADNTLIVKPETFNRPELEFDVITTKPGTKHQRLTGYLRSLPQKFGMTQERFFGSQGRRAGLGIVFCPHVNGDFGIVDVAATIRASALVPNVGIYSGTPPRGFNRGPWNAKRRETAQDFRAGKIPVLAATKAFGMGIDIPNIRYTVHFGLPGSIESFYQEAGRAGRDRLTSRCAVLFSEVSPDQTRALLGDDVVGRAAQAQYEELRALRQDDDVMRQLFFHFGSFPGREAEIDELEDVLDLISKGEQDTVRIPFGSDEKGRERAIYRLQQVGFVEDYLKEWGSKSFSVQLTAGTLADFDAAFLDFAQRAQPGQRDRWAERVADLPGLEPAHMRALALGKLLVELLYDTIERSRRRALRELVAMMRESVDDADIRRRIEDYFREGDIAPVLQRFLESEHVYFPEWLRAYADLHIDDAGELRGTTARFLESYPDHPGLLLGRAYAELLADGDAYEFEESLKRAALAATEQYAVAEGDVRLMVSWLVERSIQHNPAWAPIVWMAVGGDYADEKMLVDQEPVVLESDERAGESIIVLNRRLRRLSDDIEQVSESWR